MANELATKTHIVVFRTTQGEALFGTDNIREVSEQPFFREFLNLRIREPERYEASVTQQRPERPVAPQPVQPVQRPQPSMQASMQSPLQQRVQQLNTQVPPSSVLDITPDQMDQSVWASLSDELKVQWKKHYGFA